MKKNIFKICVLTFVVSFILVNLSIKNNRASMDFTLQQEAMACNIIPEGPEDYCWDLEYFLEYYTCTEGGIWSCYI